MLTSFIPSDLWAISPKQRLSVFLNQGPVNTRVAPSPTGHFHVGTLRTALHNLLVARASGGTFTLRIDDTDAARNDQAHVDLIHDSLRMVDISPDHTFHQSSRKSHHLAAVDYLLKAGLAIMDGAAIRIGPSCRQLAPNQFFDLANGVCSVSSTFLDQADGLVLVRSDGMPTYHFASIVDDIDHDINLILRGMDHLSNVTKQVIIAQALSAAGYPGAQRFCDRVMFAHVGLLLKDGKKLSKRDSASSMMGYLDDGIPPAALLQWVMALGWGHPDSTFDKLWPKISLADMPTVFIQGGLRSTNCSMDISKLASISKKWKRN